LTETANSVTQAVLAAGGQAWAGLNTALGE
jgi:hypothetical protein